MPEPIKMTLPYPPALNNLYLTVMMKGRPVRVPSPRAKAYKKDVQKIATPVFRQLILGEVGITFRLYRPRRVGDLDGYFKAIFDALTGIAWVDDGQITKIDAERFEDKIDPRVEIEIYARGLL